MTEPRCANSLVSSGRRGPRRPAGRATQAGWAVTAAGLSAVLAACSASMQAGASNAAPAATAAPQASAAVGPAANPAFPGVIEARFAGTAFAGGLTRGADLDLGPEVVVDSAGAGSPSLAFDPASKRLYAAWTRKTDVRGAFHSVLGTPFAASSTDGGATWSSPTQLTTEPLIGTSDPQSIGVTPTGALIDNWESYQPNPATRFGEFHQRVARSTDSGATFTLAPPFFGAADAPAPIVSRTGMTVAGDGTVWLSWLTDGPPPANGGEPGYDVALAVSRDDGRTFSPPWTVKGNACQCCGPRLAQSPTDPNTMVLAWRDLHFQRGTEDHGMQMNGMNPDGTKDPTRTFTKTDDRRVAVAVSHDGGHDFGQAVIVDYDWGIQGCPTIAPAVFIDPTGKHIGVAWFNGSPDHLGTYYAQSDDGGGTFDRPLLLGTDIVGEGYDLAGGFDRAGNAWIGWADADDHVQAAEVTTAGQLRETPRIAGTKIGMTMTDTGPVISYGNNDSVAVRRINP